MPTSDVVPEDKTSYRSKKGSIWHKTKPRGGRYGRDVVWSLYQDRSGNWKECYVCIHIRAGWFCKSQETNEVTSPTMRTAREAMDENVV